MYILFTNQTNKNAPHTAYMQNKNVFQLDISVSRVWTHTIYNERRARERESGEKTINISTKWGTLRRHVLRNIVLGQRKQLLPSLLAWSSRKTFSTWIWWRKEEASAWLVWGALFKYAYVRLDVTHKNIHPVSTVYMRRQVTRLATCVLVAPHELSWKGFFLLLLITIRPQGALSEAHRAQIDMFIIAKRSKRAHDNFECIYVIYMYDYTPSDLWMVWLCDDHLLFIEYVQHPLSLADIYLWNKEESEKRWMSSSHILQIFIPFRTTHRVWRRETFKVAVLICAYVYADENVYGDVMVGRRFKWNDDLPLFIAAEMFIYDVVAWA